MTTRMKIILAGIVVTAGVIGLLVVNIANNKSPEPSANNTPTTPQPVQPKPSDSDSEEHSGTDHVGTEYSEEVKASMLANGRQAAQAYVSQPADETSVARQDRLKRFFISSSPVITDQPPIVTPGYSTGDVTPIETSWYDTGKPGVVGVIVYLTVEVNTPTDTRTENQTWQLELIPSGISWLSNTATRSSLPYIKGVN